MPKTYEYQGDCTNFSSEEIHHLRDGADEVEPAELIAAVGQGQIDALAASLGYDDDLPLSADWHVGYWRGRLPSGQDCYYLTWSGYELLFVAKCCEDDPECPNNGGVILTPDPEPAIQHGWGQ